MIQTTQSPAGRQTDKTVRNLEVVFIVPSRYDDDGYVYQWFRGVVPSNTLAVLKGLFHEWVMKEGIDGVKSIRLTSYDESIGRIPIEKIARMNRRKGTRVLVGLIGVQSGQFARASDLAKEFRARGVEVAIGGFHVSGTLSLFDKMTPEIEELVRLGVTILQGEGETKEVFRQVYIDAARGELKPVYVYPKAPDLTDVPTPRSDPNYLRRFVASWGTCDTSRGCPFGCSFCTVINVQGRKMRSRGASGVLEMIRADYGRGVRNYFFTDDNFSRSKIWRDVFDGLIAMRSEGKTITFMMQVDTQSWKIPDFVAKAGAAGCRMCFIGMESVNPKNLESVGKSQNHVDEYRRMVHAWEKVGVLVHVGYIVGLSDDTAESLRRDILFLREHIGVHETSFFMLTPLPGSVDHKRMVEAGEWLDPDLNKYDSFHETFRHAKMTPGVWRQAATDAYARFYDQDGIVQILRRTAPKNYWYMFRNMIWYRYSGVYSMTHPMSTGLFRIKRRDLRRPEEAKESRFAFLIRRLREGGRELGVFIRLFFEFREIWLLSRPEKENKKILECFGGQAFRDIYRRWESLRDTIAVENWSGRYEDAVGNLRQILTSTSETLRRLGESAVMSSRRRARPFFALASEIDQKLDEIKDKPATPSLISQTESFIFQRLVKQYEILSSRYVRLYHSASQGRKRAIRALKRGNIFSPSLILAPWVATLDTYLALRFGWAVFREEQ